MIVDCSLFYNERLLFDTRFNELREVVDFFIVAESTTTFTGNKKSLNFDVKKYADELNSGKIIYWVSSLPDTNPWKREYAQRNSMWIPLRMLRPFRNSIVLLSDADEIPKAEKIKELTRINFNVAAFSQTLYYYKVNLKVNAPWLGTKAVRYEQLDSTAVDSFQSLRTSQADVVIQDGGWHFSYLMSPELIREKVTAFSHTELVNDNLKNIRFIQDRIAKAEDLFGRNLTMEKVIIDGSYPVYLLTNQDLFKEHTL